MKTGRALVACVVAAGALSLAASASAATFAPAGHNVTATFNGLTFSQSYLTVSCPSFSRNGTIGAASPTIFLPAGANATCAVSGTVYPPGAVTAKVKSVGGSWSLNAAATNRVNLTIPNTTLTVTYYLYGNECAHTVANAATLGFAGNWSNATSTQTLNPGSFGYTSNYGCGVPGGTAYITAGSMSLTDTTAPGTPVTVQP